MDISSKSLIVKPESQIVYDPINNNEIFFNFAPQLAFINSENCYLNYQLKFQGKGRPQPSKMAGAHGLFRRYRIQDGTASTTLDELNNYASIIAQEMGFTSNQSIEDRRSLFEGVSKTSYQGQSIFYQEYDLDTDLPDEPKSITINQPLYSDILTNPEVFPILASKGLRLQLNLAPLEQACMYQSGFVGVNQDNFIPTSVEKDTGDDSKVDINSTFTVSLTMGDSVILPFSVGDVLYISLADDTQEKILGVVTDFTSGGDVTYNPNRPNVTSLGTTYPVESKVYVKNSDRLNGVAIVNCPPAYIELALIPITYTISNIQWILNTVQPPADFVDSMMKRINSSGFAYEFRAYQSLVVNSQVLNGMSSQLIDSNASRAYSILSVPLANSYSLLSDSYKGVLDNIQSYQYFLGDNALPSKEVDLKRYNRNPALVQPIHLSLLTDALTNTLVETRNFQNINERFMIGHAFSKYGNTANLNDQTLRLEVYYSGGEIDKSWYHFVQHVKRITVNKSGITVT